MGSKASSIELLLRRGRHTAHRRIQPFRQRTMSWMSSYQRDRMAIACDRVMGKGECQHHANDRTDPSFHIDHHHRLDGHPLFTTRPSSTHTSYTTMPISAPTSPIDGHFDNPLHRLPNSIPSFNPSDLSRTNHLPHDPSDNAPRAFAESSWLPQIDECVEIQTGEIEKESITASSSSSYESTAATAYAYTEERIGRPLLINTVPSTIYDTRRRTGFSVRAEIIRVINGIYHSQPATYIGLVVSFDDPSIVRSSKVQAVITPQEEPFTRYPSIVRYSPKQIYGEPKAIDTTTSHGLEGEVGVSNVGLTSQHSHTSSTSRDVRRRVVCYTKPPPHGHGRSVLELDARENPVQGEGIVPELPIGFIVSHHGETFALTVTVEVKRSLVDRVYPIIARPYRDERPALFDCRGEYLRYGDEALDKEMDNWDEAVWKGLVSYGQEYENVSSFKTSTLVCIPLADHTGNLRRVTRSMTGGPPWRIGVPSTSLQLSLYNMDLHSCRNAQKHPRDYTDSETLASFSFPCCTFSTLTTLSVTALGLRFIDFSFLHKFPFNPPTLPPLQPNHLVSCGSLAKRARKAVPTIAVPHPAEIYHPRPFYNLVIAAVPAV